MNTAEYIEAALKATKSTSYYQLAKKIGISQARISDYRAGTRRPDEYACTRLAVALGIDPAVVIAEIALEWEKNEEKRRWWSDFLRYFGRASGIVITLGLIYFASSPVAQAAGGAISGPNHNFPLCELWRRLFGRWTVYRARPAC